MPNKSYILFNSIPRCGNTFLAYAFEEAIKINYPGGKKEFEDTFSLVTHAHQPLLLKIPKSDRSIVQFTIFRNPVEQIPSLFALEHYRQFLNINSKNDQDRLKQEVINSINEYQQWISLYNENKNSNLITFDDLKNDINLVLQYIFETLQIKFKNRINEHAVKRKVKNFDGLFKDEKELFFMGSLPREFSKSKEYLMIQNMLENDEIVKPYFNKLNQDYYNIVKMGEK